MLAKHVLYQLSYTPVFHTSARTAGRLMTAF